MSASTPSPGTGPDGVAVSPKKACPYAAALTSMSPRLASTTTSSPCSRADWVSFDSACQPGAPSRSKQASLELHCDALLGGGVDHPLAVRRSPPARRLPPDCTEADGRRASGRGQSAAGSGSRPRNKLRATRGDGVRQSVAEAGPARCPGHGQMARDRDTGARRVDYLTDFFRPAPAVNFGTFDAAIWILSPVAGFRPSRALRCETLNLPKPENVISPPRLRVPSIVSSTASTALHASFLLRPARSATWSTNSDFVTCSSSLGGRGSRR